MNLARSQDPLVIKNSNTSGKRTLSIKVLALQAENLVLTPRTHIGKLGLTVHTCNPRGVKKRQSLGLIGQLALETTHSDCRKESLKCADNCREVELGGGSVRNVLIVQTGSPEFDLVAPVQALCHEFVVPLLGMPWGSLASQPS